MTRIVTVALSVLLPTFLNAQTSSTTTPNDFPKENINELLNRELKVLPLPRADRQFGYRSFYFDREMDQAYALPPYSTTSNYDSLVNRVFKLVRIDPVLDSITDQKSFRLTLQNPERGTLYYNYEPEYDFNWHFEVVGGFKLRYTTEYYCKKITKNVDKFTNVTMYMSEQADGLQVVKMVKGSSKTIFLAVSIMAATVNVNKKGVSLLLENKTRIDRPAEPIDVDTGISSFFKYTALIKLTPAEIAMLKASKITDIKVYIYTGEIQNGEEIIEYLKCMTN